MDGPRLLSGGGATSLLNLKAELYRKQEACKLSKQQQNHDPIKRMMFKGQEIIPKKKKKNIDKVDASSQLKVDPEEEEMLQKSRSSLEAKAKLYDEIVKNKIEIDDEMAENYLVDFHRKEKLDLSVDIKENKMYTDTDNSPTTEDLPKQQFFQDMSISNEQDETICTLPGKSKFSTALEDYTVLTSETKEKLEETEDTVTGGRPLHYQNVLFNEVRDHGVGYFAFSRDEQKRQEQMETLNSLHEQAKESKQSKLKMQQRKNALLQSRLAKVCQRRNIDKKVIESLISKPEEDTQKNAESSLSSDKSIAESDTTTSDPSVSESPSAPHKVRPWDVGKSCDGVQNAGYLKKRSSEKNWIELQREERINEFAPPSFYFDTDGRSDDQRL